MPTVTVKRKYVSTDRRISSASACPRSNKRVSGPPDRMHTTFSSRLRNTADAGSRAAISCTILCSAKRSSFPAGFGGRLAEMIRVGCQNHILGTGQVQAEVGHSLLHLAHVDPGADHPFQKTLLKRGRLSRS